MRPRLTELLGSLKPPNVGIDGLRLLISAEHAALHRFAYRDLQKQIRKEAIPHFYPFVAQGA